MDNVTNKPINVINKPPNIIYEFILSSYCFIRPIANTVSKVTNNGTKKLEMHSQYHLTLSPIVFTKALNPLCVLP